MLRRASSDERAAQRQRVRAAGEALAIKGTPWSTRLPASAVISGPKPPPTGRRGRPRETGERIGKCKDAAADWREVTVRI